MNLPHCSKMSIPLLPLSPTPTLPHVTSHRHILIPARVGGDGHTQLGIEVLLSFLPEPKALA